jgi:hypothetical protein
MIALSSARIVMPIPPKQWFGGQDRRALLAIVQHLQQRFGTTFYHFDTTPFIYGETRKQQDAIAKLRAYKPHLAIAAANYGLACAVKTRGGAANVFTDILGIPLMMLWDHGLFAFPSLILAPLAERPEESRPDSLRRVSAVIDTPLMHHYPIDSAQLNEMRRIGMLHTDNVELMHAMAYKPFLDFGEKRQSRHHINDVAFIGNVSLSQLNQPKDDQSIVGQCRAAVIGAKSANPSTAAWPLLVEHVEALSGAERAESRLDYDQSFFWNFANKLICVHCNTQSRMQTLDSLKRKVAFYGAFADPGGIPRLKESEYIDYKGYVHFSSELPQVYAESRIVVDITNAAFISNCSTKPICCFASGGFCLFDYKADPVKHLGSDVEKVMFRSLDDLNAKIDHFLTNERERESLADHLRDVVRRKCDFQESVYQLATAILAEKAGGGIWSSLRGAASKVFAGRPRSGPTPLQLNDEPDKPVASTRRLAGVSMLPDISPYWAGAKLLSGSPLQIQTAKSSWGYSAVFPIAKHDRARGTPGALWLQVTVRMISGSAGLGIFLHGEMTEERLISTEDGLCTLLFPLPAKDQCGLLIRSAEMPSSILEFTDISLVVEEPARAQ